MTPPRRFVRAAASVFFAVLLGGPLLRAQLSLPPAPVPLETLAAFRAPTPNWRLAGGLAGNPRRENVLTPAPGTGIVVNQPREDAKGHLFTVWEHGDIELELEFLVPAGSNSGIYLQGRYEVQLYDSWGTRDPKHSDAGGIYERWDDARGAGKEGFEGHAPKANASRAPGLWQRLQVTFEAPRFDGDGRKIRAARFVRVALNGFVVQENLEVTGPTRSPAFSDEKPTGPLMIQGDHGPVAIRAIAVKHLGTERLGVEDVAYKLYSGDFKLPGEYDGQTPASAGTPARFAQAAVEKSGKFALVFTGTLVAPRTGEYAFNVETSGRARLLVDGRPVTVPLERGNQPGTIALAAGRHPFRIDFIHTSNARPAFELLAEGPGIAPHAVTVRDAPAGRGGGPGGRGPRPLLVEPAGRVLAMRGFVPFDPRKRLYAVNVGTPAGVHYAYDTETGGLLRAWRGSFLDTIEMWNARGESQLAKPAGPALTFNDKPNVVLIESASTGDWPDRPDALWTAQGYTLEADGLPVFSSALAELTFRDRIAPLPEGRGLARTLTAGGKLPSWSAWVLLAEAEQITPQPDGRGWIVGDREWYLDWPADSAVTPVLRSVRGRQQLAVPLVGASLEKPIAYSIVW